MGITNELKQTLKRLRLSGMLATLPDRVAYAKGTKLAYAEFLELVLNDEIQRREDGNIERRLRSATVDLDHTFERFDWDAAITMDKDKLKEVFSLEFVGRNENILICGPVGVGKTFIANALAHSACRRGCKVVMLRASAMFKKLRQSRADNSYGKELLKLISPELLVIDDFGLQKLTEVRIMIKATSWYEGGDHFGKHSEAGRFYITFAGRDQSTSPDVFASTLL